jgi:hypothetical protein
MKSRTARLLGRGVRLTDGRVGVVTSTASQERHAMVRLRFEDGSETWHKLCDVTLIEPDEPAPSR